MSRFYGDLTDVFKLEANSTRPVAARHPKKRTARPSSSSGNSGASEPTAFPPAQCTETGLSASRSFIELCRTAPTLLALQYLQNDLASVVDHSSPAESASFRACMTALMSAPARMNIDIPLDGSQELPSPAGSEAGGDRIGDALYRERHSLFEEISQLVPQSERQPDENLEDTSRLLRVWQMTGTRA